MNTRDLEQLLEDTDLGPDKTDDRYFQRFPARAEPVALIDSSPKESSRDESILVTEAEGSLTLPFAPITDALRDVPADPEWTWEGYLASGSLTLLAGRPKVGKSTIVFGLLEPLAVGEPFLERTTRKQGVVLLSEERHGTLAEKAQRFALPEAVHLLMRHQVGETPWRSVVEQAADYCHARRLGVLVVDTLHEWTKLGGDSENASGSVLTALEPLQAAAATGLSVLLVAHQRKSFGEFAEAVRGSNALVGGVDVIVELERPGAGVNLDGARVLRALSRYTATPAELAAVLEEDGYRVTGDLVELRSEGELERLRTALAEREHATAEELADATDIPKATVHKRLKELGDEITHEGAGKRNDPFVYRFVTAPPLVTNRV